MFVSFLFPMQKFIQTVARCFELVKHMQTWFGKDGLENIFHRTCQIPVVEQVSNKYWGWRSGLADWRQCKTISVQKGTKRGNMPWKIWCREISTHQNAWSYSQKNRWLSWRHFSMSVFHLKTGPALLAPQIFFVYGQNNPSKAREISRGENKFKSFFCGKFFHS